MINPILENVSTVYLVLCLVLFVLFIIDWSFGYDRVINKLDALFDKLDDYIPIEAIYPAILLTLVGMLCLFMSIPFGVMFFGNMAIMFGAMGVSYIFLLALVTVLRLLLLKFRNYSISRREQKANAKKSLTDPE